MPSKTTSLLKQVFLVVLIGTLLASTNIYALGITPQAAAYAVEVKLDPITQAIEYQFKLDGQHFGTIIDQGGTFAFRPHPGCDANGWGSTWYAQPFLPGALLKHTVVSTSTITANPNGIQAGASGMVSRGSSEAYGNWSSSYSFSFIPPEKKVSSTGHYTITLSAPLSIDTGDLNLYKLASNYLDDVPLLTGGTGDTGDMLRADIAGTGILNSSWIPPNQPSHFPNNQTDALSINVVGQFNTVNTAALGQAQIAPAFKPNIKVGLIAKQANTNIRFGAIYTTALSQTFSADNVGITPIIHRTSLQTQFNFTVTVESIAVEGCSYLPIILKQ